MRKFKIILYLVKLGRMKINTLADDKYTTAVFHILNKIKDKLLLNLEKKQIIDYMFDLNIKRVEPSFIEEKAILQKLKNDGIISEIEEINIMTIGKKKTPQYKAYEIYHFKVSENFNDYYNHYQKIQNVSQNYCWFDNNAFFLKLQDNSIYPISFDTERGNRGMLVLFQVMVEHWKKNENIPITGNEIVKAMAKFGLKVETQQLKNIISNVRNKKIKPAGLENKIKIIYDKKTNGWVIDIER